MKRIRTQLKLAAATALTLLLPGGIWAQSMSSTNYRVPFDDLSAGGNYGTSSNYSAWDTVAETSTPSGEDLSSANYEACAGFQCLLGAPFLTVAFAVQSTPCTDSSTSSPPYSVSLGTLSTASVSTAANHICVVVSGNASYGFAVQGKSANAALASVSTPTDTIPSQTETLTAGDPGYGFCSANAANGFTAASPFNGTCNTGSGHAVGAITTSQQTIWSSPGPVNRAYGDLLTKAAISSTIAAHSDYRDTLTLTVTGTY